jgi:elongation factor Ts
LNSVAEYTAKDVQRLRQASGAGMMDAKKALDEKDGDFEAALQLLREKGIAKADARTDRESVDGAVAIAAGPNRAALVELRSETDFSAKATDFVALTQALADAVLAGGAGAVDEFTDRIDDLRIAKKENIQLGTVALIEAGDGSVLDTYLHVQDGRGTNGVVVEASGVDAATLHEIALHIAFAKPIALTRAEIPAEDVEREREAALGVTKAEGKPEAAWDKIVEGRLNKWYADRVLLEQGLFGEKETVQQKVGAGAIVRFVQAVIGS